jgi:transposase
MSKTNSVKIIIGVDTHKDIHAAVATKEIGARLGTLTIPVRTKGYRDLEIWARAFGAIHAFGIEGTGSYGAGLSRFLQAKGHSVASIVNSDITTEKAIRSTLRTQHAPCLAVKQIRGLNQPTARSR